MSIQFLSKIVVLFASLLALLFGQCALSADIVLRQKVTPVKSVISLGDIADIQGTSVAERQQLALTPLWVAPPVGEQRYVSSQQVKDILANRGFAVADLNVYGAPRVAIGWEEPKPIVDSPSDVTAPQAPVSSSMGFRSAPSTQATASTSTAKQAKRNPIFLSDIQRDQLADQVREAVVIYLEDQSGRIGMTEVDFTLPRRHGDLLSTQTTEVTVSGGKSPWMGRQSLVLHFDSEKGPLDLPLSVRIFDTTPVLIAKRPIARGQMITAADVAIESPSRDARMPIGKAMVYSLDEALGKESSQAIREGQVVTADLCLAPLMVRRNEIISIVSAGGGLSIRRNAKALTDARQGDVTEVQLLDSRERLVGRVVGRGELATLGSTLAPRSESGARQSPAYR